MNIPLVEPQENTNSQEPAMANASENSATNTSAPATAPAPATVMADDTALVDAHSQASGAKDQ